MAQLPNDFQTHGLMATFWDSPINPLVNFHRHNEIELNLVGRGSAILTMSGRSVVMPTQSLSVFWAGFTHRLVVWEAAEMWTLSIPLAVFLGWPLPQEAFVHRLLHGDLLYELDASKWELDRILFNQWHQDLKDGASAERKEIVLLEAQSRLRRLSTSMGRGTKLTHPGVEQERVASMLHFIAEHYREDLTVAQIAKSANTTPSYAMELFNRSCGSSIMQYVNDQRIAHARRMLATTDAKILEVAMDSGFGSESQFYNVFKRVCGQSPREYARANGGRVAVKV